MFMLQNIYKDAKEDTLDQVGGRLVCSQLPGL